jgi:anhydro-N-acetylmuramic acid kinase
MRIDGPVRALGAMSGTSLDGVDAAVVVTDGDRIVEFGETAYRPYSRRRARDLRAALGRMPGAGRRRGGRGGRDGPCRASGGLSGDRPRGLPRPDARAPTRRRGTHQAGDGAVLAALGLPVVWDFRTADVTLGGQGAPLAPFFHFACAPVDRRAEPLAFLNIGGVANLTWVDPSCPRPRPRARFWPSTRGRGTRRSTTS